MKRYDTYKDSGVQWLGEIPGHWECVKLKMFCQDNKEKNKGNIESCVLSLSYGNIIVKKNVNFGLVPENYESYQIVNPGNIILRLTDLQNDHKSLRTGLVKNRGIITSAYVGLIVKNMNSEYTQLILHSYDVMKVFYGMGGGLRQSMSYTDIANVYIPVPPLSEQRSIVSFLDAKCGKIDEWVTKKQKEVEHLQELKQRVIADAVTRGLNPHVKMKATNIPWLKEIPEHWGCMFINRLFNIKAGGDVKPELYADKKDENHPFPVYTNTKSADDVYAYTSLATCPSNSITVTGRGEVGHAFFRETPYDAIVRLLSLTPKSNIICKFYAYFIDTVIPFSSDSAAIGQLSAVQIKQKH